MAAFKTQIEDLIGSVGDDAALVSWLNDGGKELVNIMPSHLLSLCASQSTFTSTAVGSEAETLNTAKILNVFRNDGDIDQPCREIHSSIKGRVLDSSEMQYASITDPVYYIENNKINALPDGGSCKYSEVQYPVFDTSGSGANVDIDDSGDTTVPNFPDEAEYLLVLYAAIRGLQRKMSDMQTVSAIDTTALGAITTELDKADNIINTANGKVDAFYTSIGDIDDTTELWDSTNKRFKVVRDALNYAGNLIDNDKPHADYDVAQNLLDVNAAFDGIQAHLADGEAILTNDPTSGDIAAALTAMKDAIEAAESMFDKMEESASSVFGDSDTFTAASSQLTRVKAAIDNAEDVINSDQPSTTTDAFGAQAAEDVELVASALSIAQAELSRAQVHLSEWTAIGDMRIKEVNASLAEAQAYGSEVQARLSYANAYQQASAARGQEGQNRIEQARVTLSVAQQELARANVAIAEINTIIASYRLELEGVGPYLQSAQGYVAQAQGYVAEAGARMQREDQKYNWYQSQQTKLQNDYDRGIQMLLGVQVKGSA